MEPYMEPHAKILSTFRAHPWMHTNTNTDPDTDTDTNRHYTSYHIIISPTRELAIVLDGLLLPRLYHEDLRELGHLETAAHALVLLLHDTCERVMCHAALAFARSQVLTLPQDATPHRCRCSVLHKAHDATEHTACALLEGLACVK